MPGQFKKWEIPPSYDLGIPPYFHNIFKDHPLIKGYLRERLAHIDARLDPETYKPFEEQENPDIPLSEQPSVGQDAVFGMFRRCGLSKDVEESINSYIRHLAYNHTDPVNLFRLKEFIAFCGVDGVYDLQRKKHIRITPKTDYMPLSIIPDEWRKEKDIPRIRRQMALMMDEHDDIKRMRSELNKIESKLWSGFRKQTLDRMANGLPVNSFDKDLKRRAKYLEENPSLLPLHEEWQALLTKREETIAHLMDKYAPLDEDYVLPEVNPEFDYYWDQNADAQVGQDKPLREKYEAYWLEQGLDWRDDAYVPYSHNILRQRTFTIKDWALRDYTLNEVNRTSYVDMRRHDLPRAFVDTVKAELEDGMLSICEAPNRIEPVPDEPGQFYFIVNNCEAGTFSLDEVHELERSFEENEGITATDSNGFLLTGRQNPKQRDPALGKEVRDGSNLANVSVDPDALLALLEADDDEGISKLIMDSAEKQREQAHNVAKTVETIDSPSPTNDEAAKPKISAALEGEWAPGDEHTHDQVMEEDAEDGFIVSFDLPPPVEMKPLTQADLPFPDVPLDLTDEEMENPSIDSESELDSGLIDPEEKSRPKKEAAVKFGRTNNFRPKFGETPDVNKGAQERGQKVPLGKEMQGGGLPFRPAELPKISPDAYISSSIAAPARSLAKAAKSGFTAGTKGLSKAGRVLTKGKGSKIPVSDRRMSMITPSEYKGVNDALDKLKQGRSNGKTLTKEERVATWDSLKKSMNGIETEVQGIVDKGDKITDKDLLRARQLKNLASRIGRNAETVRKDSDEERNLSESAKEQADTLSKSLEKLIEAILKLFGIGNSNTSPGVN